MTSMSLGWHDSIFIEDHQSCLHFLSNYFKFWQLVQWFQEIKIWETGQTHSWWPCSSANHFLLAIYADDSPLSLQPRWAIGCCRLWSACVYAEFQLFNSLHNFTLNPTVFFYSTTVSRFQVISCSEFSPLPCGSWDSIFMEDPCIHTSSIKVRVNLCSFRSQLSLSNTHIKLFCLIWFFTSHEQSFS